MKEERTRTRKKEDYGKGDKMDYEFGRYEFTISLQKVMAQMPENPNIPTMIKPMLEDMMTVGTTNFRALDENKKDKMTKLDEVKNTTNERFK